MHWAIITIAICWISFLLVWGVTAVFAKKDDTSTAHLRRSHMFWVIRIVVLIAAAVILSTRNATGHISYVFPLSTSFATGIIGVALSSIGIGIAIWARVYLGRNWSSHPAMKVGHELVTTGPYAYVRHPIYTGLLIAVIGSALGVSPVWFIIFVIALAIFLYRIRTEERYMMELFPDHYPEYRKRTKALVPFVW